MSQSPAFDESHSQFKPPARNIHGRRPGRGLRPYLIIAKILSVACFFGGLLAVLVGVLLGPEPRDIAAWRQELALLHRIYGGVVVPGIVAALGFGTLLFASIWRAMIRMRWFVVKMVLVAVAVPGLHVSLSGKVLALRAVLFRVEPDLRQASVLRGEIATITGLGIVFAVAAIILGRVKPRLGQDYGRTFGTKVSRQGD